MSTCHRLSRHVHPQQRYLNVSPSPITPALSYTSRARTATRLALALRLGSNVSSKCSPISALTDANLPSANRAPLSTSSSKHRGLPSCILAVHRQPYHLAFALYLPKLQCHHPAPGYTAQRLAHSADFWNADVPPALLCYQATHPNPCPFAMSSTVPPMKSSRTFFSFQNLTRSRLVHPQVPCASIQDRSVTLLHVRRNACNTPPGKPSPRKSLTHSP
jgi:hypothetical protein